MTTCWLQETDMERFDRITSNPAVMNGKPCIRGTRLTVRRVVESVGLYPDRAELKREFPELADEDIAQAIAFAARYVDDEVVNLEAA
jgi:uncharacterized protein (DUF433 family)